MSDIGTPEIERRLGQEVLRIHEDCFGIGAGSARASIQEDAVVVFLDDVELQKSEEYLISEGHDRAVRVMRAEVEEATAAAAFTAAVERATGRKVSSFASVTKIEPNYVIEVFRLAPR